MPHTMNGRLAIVDDDFAFLEYLSVWLSSRGFSVEQFSSGTALLEGLRRGAAPDAVLLDVQMPDLNGLDTLRAIRQLQPTAQVIMLSGRNVPATIVEAVRLGAADYVLKPGDPEGVGEAALEAAINNALERQALADEVARLSAQSQEAPDGTQTCWSPDRAMQSVMSMVERVADSDVDILIRGESGVGKEVVAREIHRRSERRLKPYVKVNCAALPADLLESELFGHERGAFTGAGNLRVGKFEFAQRGTLLLDEIGEMAPALQAKLLHVLQDRSFTRLGSNKPVDVDVRVIAATNRDLGTMMAAGTFREDLYYRLQVIEIFIPPLRERQSEIAPLSEFFLSKYAAVYRRPQVRPSTTLINALRQYSWPGNIRELENMMKRFVVLQDEGLLLGELERNARTAPPAPAPEPVTVAAGSGPRQSSEGLAPSVASHAADVAVEVPVPVLNPAIFEDADGGGLLAIARAAALKAEREAIVAALARFRWNRRKAAEDLGVSYKTLLTKMKSCGISDPVES
ncbi:MAG: sigma-54 dependent transcriptional regulator [Vicinamibacterales bacterium]